MRLLRRIFILFCLLMPLLGAQASNLDIDESKLSQPTYEVKVEMDVKVPMSDRIELSTNIYRPDALGKFPVILIRTPYSNGNENNKEGHFFAKRGYAVVIQDTRGRFESEGEFNPFFDEIQDGYDAQEWAATQPWSNGKLGTTGGSYVGFTQWTPAPLANKHLVAMFPIVTFGNFHKLAYVGGAFQFATIAQWSINMACPPEKRADLLKLDWHKLIRHLPIMTLDEQVIGIEIPFLRRWLAHPEYSDYWKPANIRNRYDDIQVPICSIAGWYDLFSKDGFMDFNGVRYASRNPTARANQYIIMGPWLHGAIGENGKIGDIEFGEDAVVNFQKLSLRWNDYWLKGMDTGVKDDPPIWIFVMGENVWRNEREWPLARTNYTKYYFHSKGKANTLSGDGELSTEPPEDEPMDKYVYDPDNPVPTMGGNNLVPLLTPMGPRDQRSVEEREDVLVYTSPELDVDVEVTGPISVELYASTSAKDTDFTAKFVDVYPDGRVINLCDGIIRARYRKSSKKPELLEPGKIYKYTIDVMVTSNVFKKGHRIRVEISSSNFPRFDRNTNTGNTIAQDDKAILATQTIYHDADHPSHILLPIIR